MLTLPKKEHEFENPPADTHIATCYRVVDLGTQAVSFNGQTKYQHKIMLSWELDCLMADGEPFSMHKRYTLSSSDKSNFRKDIEAWRGAPFNDDDFGNFDIGKLIGKSCLMGVSHVKNEAKQKVYANISALIKLPKGTIAPPLKNPIVYFSLNDFDQEKYNSLSDSVKATIALSPEYQKIIGVYNKHDDIDDNNEIPSYLDDGIPF